MKWELAGAKPLRGMLDEAEGVLRSVSSQSTSGNRSDDSPLLPA
jgi:hypothetical protein